MAAVVVTPSDAAVHIANKNLLTLHTAQMVVVAALHTQVAHIVARLIIGVTLNIGLRHLADVAQHIAGSMMRILSEDSFLDIKSGIAVKFLLQTAVIVSRKMGQQGLRRIGGISGRFAQLFQTGLQLIGGDTQRVAEVGRVEVVHIARNHHHIIGRLIEHHQRVVAIVNQSTRGIYGFAQKSVVVGVSLVFVVGNLKRKEPEQIYAGNDDDKTADHIFAFL